MTNVYTQPTITPLPTPPPLAEEQAIPIARLYSNDFHLGNQGPWRLIDGYWWWAYYLWGMSFNNLGGREGGPQSSHTPKFIGGTYTTKSARFVVFYFETAVTVTPAPGWTLVAERGGPECYLKIYYKMYDGVDWTYVGHPESGGGGENVYVLNDAFTFSSAVEFSCTTQSYDGCTSSPIDKVATNSGTGTVLTTGATATTTQDLEYVACFFASPFLSVYTMPSPPNTYTTPTYSNDLAFGGRVVSTYGSYSGTLVQDNSSEWAAAVITLKLDGTVSRCNPVAQIDSVLSGSATTSAWDVGDFTLEIDLNDPAAQQIVESMLVEVWVPSTRDGDAPYTFEWYIIRHLDIDYSKPVPTLTIAGPSLKSYVADRALHEDYINAWNTPYYMVAENWIRSFVYASCQVHTETLRAGSDYHIPNFSLDTSGNRGSYYYYPPARVGQTLGQIISEVYKKDLLGWRVVPVNIGTQNAALQFQTYIGTDKTLGKTDDIVFSMQWDSAETVHHIRDAVGAATAITVRGKPTGTLLTREYAFVENATMKAIWGVIHKYVDATDRENDDITEVAASLLASMLPQSWAEVLPTTRYRYNTHYKLLDKVTTITRTYVRYDSQITQATMKFGPEQEIGVGKSQAFGEHVGPGSSRGGHFGYDPYEEILPTLKAYGFGGV